MNLLRVLRRMWSFLKDTLVAPVVLQLCVAYCLIQRRLYQNPNSWRRDWREELILNSTRSSTLAGASRDIPRMNFVVGPPPPGENSTGIPAVLSQNSHDSCGDGANAEVDCSPASCRVRGGHIVSTLVRLAHLCKAAALAESLNQWWTSFSSDEANRPLIEQPDARIWVQRMLQHLFVEVPPREADGQLFFALLGVLSQGTVFPAVQHVYNILWAPHVARMTDVSWTVFVNEHPTDDSQITITHRLVTRCESPRRQLSVQWDLRIDISRITSSIQSCALAANHIVTQDVHVQREDCMLSAALWKLRLHATQERLRNGLA